MALTTDIWTSMSTEAYMYMMVTVHYVDPNWVLQEFVLETLKDIPESISLTS